MRQFNYYGNIPEEEIDEEDVEKLEREIEEVLKNRGGTADDQQSNMTKTSGGIINIGNGVYQY